jgi:hypothetical protein
VEEAELLAGVERSSVGLLAAASPELRVQVVLLQLFPTAFTQQ